jgi:hypothetical protein
MTADSQWKRRRMLFLTMLCFATWNTAHAQEPASPPWLIGVSLGIPRAYGRAVSEAALVSVHWTHYRPNRLTFDGSLGIMPRLSNHRRAALIARPALAVPIKITNDLLIMPIGGVTLGAVSGSGNLGYHTGLAAMLFEPERFGLRLGATRHQFGKSQAPVWLFEVGLTRRP